MKLPDSVYNVIKWWCVIACPAICTLIVTLANLWGWQIPTEAIVGTITAITTCLGILVGISNYNIKRDEK